MRLLPRYGANICLCRGIVLENIEYIFCKKLFRKGKQQYLLGKNSHAFQAESSFRLQPFVKMITLGQR